MPLNGPPGRNISNVWIDIQIRRKVNVTMIPPCYRSLPVPTVVTLARQDAGTFFYTIYTDRRLRSSSTSSGTAALPLVFPFLITTQSSNSPTVRWRTTRRIESHRFCAAPPHQLQLPKQLYLFHLGSFPFGISPTD